MKQAAPIARMVSLLVQVSQGARGRYARKLLRDLMEDYSDALRPVVDTDASVCQSRGTVPDVHVMFQSLWQLWANLIHPRDLATEELFNHLGDLNPRERRACLREPRLCSLMGRRVGGIEEVFEVFSPPTHNVPRRGQRRPIPTIHSVDGALLPPPETPDGGPEFPQSRPEVVLHGLTELLPYPSFCFSDHQSCIPLGQPVPISCLGSPTGKKKAR
ncbi:uncharacterized protein chrna9a [Phyllopteryx taeniolatus]|uniref:uncharacterized protein chrna9a n=1 Tax=Phyllopteryx taeniolatus TaxID=161469 RepID=UPI002AD3F125|nr:uncharacterized protein chrna9a [Phyllopteryx taeniolatus]